MRLLRKPWVILLCAAILLAAYFAADLPFFTYETSLSRASLETVEDGSGLYFTYQNDAITLHTDGAATVYALTLDGVAALEGGAAETFPDTFRGSFAAVQAAAEADADGDGDMETVVYAAKTDMAYTQEYAVLAPRFDSAVLPLELTVLNRETATLSFDGEALADAQVTVTYSGGTQSVLTTQADGTLPELTYSALRRGVTLLYQPDEAAAWVLRYQAEDNTLFSLRYLSAIAPFALIVGLSAVCILLDLLLRRRLYHRAGVPAARAAAGRGARGMARAKPPLFSIVRWSVMVVSFVLLIFGGRLLGTTFSQLQLPVLACPYNLDQLTGASCYLFGHLDVLFASSAGEIALFFGSFLGCAVLLGRVVCGFVCPLGLLQDVTHQVRLALHVEGIALTEKLYAVLRLVKWVLLIAFLGLGLVGGSFCDVCPAMALSPALAGFKLSLYLGGFVMVAVLVSGFFKRRSFCSICPMGYLLGLMHKLSLFRLKKDAVACTECGACYEACPMGIKTIFTQRSGKGDVRKLDVTTADCIFCGACVRCCPEDKALSITFGGKVVYAASRMDFMAQARKQRKEPCHGCAKPCGRSDGPEL